MRPIRGLHLDIVFKRSTQRVDMLRNVKFDAVRYLHLAEAAPQIPAMALSETAPIVVTLSVGIDDAGRTAGVCDGRGRRICPRGESVSCWLGRHDTTCS